MFVWLLRCCFLLIIFIKHITKITVQIQKKNNLIHFWIQEKRNPFLPKLKLGKWRINAIYQEKVRKTSARERKTSSKDKKTLSREKKTLSRERKMLAKWFAKVFCSIFIFFCCFDKYLFKFPVFRTFFWNLCKLLILLKVIL